MPYADSEIQRAYHRAYKLRRRLAKPIPTRTLARAWNVQSPTRLAFLRYIQHIRRDYRLSFVTLSRLGDSLQAVRESLRSYMAYLEASDG